MTGNVTLNQALTTAQQTSNSSQQLAQDFDSFLLPLTTQLQNQDPLSPMDSTEFTNQLVQFSQVEQQINQNSKLDQIIALSAANLTGSALSYVGMDVMVSGNAMYFDGERPLQIDYQLRGDAGGGSKLRIENENGILVRTLDAEVFSGTHRAIWDGKNEFGNNVPIGRYKVFVDAIDVDDNPVQNSTAVSATVDGVDTQNGRITLLLEGGVQTPVEGILSVSRPKEAGGSSS